MLNAERGHRRILQILGLGLLVALGCNEPAAESPTRGTLAVAVAESHARLAGGAADLFCGLYPDARLRVRATTTREAFIALLEDSVRLAVVDRPPNVEEAQALAAASVDLGRVVIAEDALALVVNAANELPGVTLEQAARILAGETRDWSELPASSLRGPVDVVTTDRNSGSWELLDRFFPHAGVPRPNRVVSTQHEVLQHVAATPAAIGVVSVAAWRAPAPGNVAVAVQDGEAGWAKGVESPAIGSAVRPLNVVTSDSLGVDVSRALHQANIYLGAYPLHYPVLVYFDKRSRLAAGFSAFLASAPGQKRILDAGLVPVKMPVRLVHLR